MKIILASSVTPFLQGGYTVIVDSLTDALRRAGHEVEVLLFPFDTEYEGLLDQMVGFRMIDLSQHGDLLITVRFPSYLLRHPNKVVWFIHHHRGAYDLWGTEYQDIPRTPEGLRIRDSIRNADATALAECRRVFSNSGVVARRLREYNGVDAEVLYPPLPLGTGYVCGGYGEFVLYVSRMVHHKRQWLAVEAMRHVKTDVKLVLVGAPDPGTESYLRGLHETVARHGLEDRVKIHSGWMDHAAKVDLFGQCLAAAYFPVDEDSYGYPSLEAYAARKPVITTWDSGGTLELVLHGENGLVAESTPESVAAAMDRLFSDREEATIMGQAGWERMAEMGIHWDHVVGRLTAG